MKLIPFLGSLNPKVGKEENNRIISKYELRLHNESGETNESIII